MNRSKMEQFQHLRPIGFIPALANHSKEKEDSLPKTIFFHEYESRFPEKAEKLKAHLGHKLVGYSEDRQRIQEKKMDKKPQFPDDEFIKVAVDYTYRMYQSCLEATLTTTPSVHGSKSPAFPYTKEGFSTKAEAIISEFHKELMQDKPTPIWKDSAKGGEALPVEDLREGKLRTFSQVPLFFAIYQKFFFEDQNDRMKENHSRTWGQYGWVKQYGGFNRLFKDLEAFQTRVMGDVSGWDRSIWLKVVYELRKRGLLASIPWLKDNKQLMDLMDWVIKNTVNPITSFVDGSIWERLTGNCSGSNNTTTDNTLAHTVVLFYFFIKQYHSTHGVIPTYEAILEATRAKLFGDDSAFSFCVHTFGFTNEEQVKEAMKLAYAAFGLTLKPTAIYVDWENSGPVKGIEFLGSTGEWSEKLGLYVAKPRLSKLAYSLCCSNEDGTLQTEIQKATTLWDLVCLVDTPFKMVVHDYCEFLRVKAREVHFEGIGQSFINNLDRVLMGKVDWALIQGYE